ncbi:MAG: response regulator [Chloroflexia bacterium]|nr:response regulator [Chloroflexia bacterium]
MEGINILLVEDQPGDARILQEMLLEASEAPFQLTCAARLDEAIDLLRQSKIDVILLDLNLPDSQGLDTVHSVYSQAPDIAIVVLTGLDDEDLARRTLQAGGQDYLVKGQLDRNLLLRSLHYAIERKKAEREREELIRQLQEALRRIKQLRGMLPICAHCKKIRNDKGYWQQVEEYISEHSEAEFSHGLCPDCLRDFYPEYGEQNESSR